MNWVVGTYFMLVVCIATSSCMPGLIVPPESDITGCESYRSILTRTLVKFAATYFADNPRQSDSHIVPSQVDPLTPSKLFEEFYGDTATPEHFKEAILQIYYADPGPGGPVKEDSDKILLRENIHTYASANSYELAREKFGLLLYSGISDYAADNPRWINSRCLDDTRMVVNAEDVITSELERVRNAIGGFRLGAFLDLGSGTTLAFVIDDTGSMSGEIQAAKARAKQIIDERQGSLDQPQDFVLVPFNDPTVGPLTATNNPGIFKAAIDRLYAHGGGDAPELALRGILLAVENSRHGSTIFVITDVDAKDVELQDVVVAQAQQKNIKITFLLTRRFRTSMCLYFTRSGDKLETRRCSTKSFKLGFELYEYIASSTGGNILVVSKGDIFRATQVIDKTVKQGVVDIHYDVLSEGTGNVPFHVDSSISEVFLQLTGQCQNAVITVGGNALNITDPITVGDLFEGKLMVDGRYGEWRLSVDVERTCQVKIIGRSTKGFIRKLAQEIKIDGENVLELFEGQPLMSDKITILVDAYGKQPADRVSSIDFISQENGNVIASFRQTDGGQNEFRVPMSSNPTLPFLVMVRGTDASGFSFTRVLPSVVQFTNVEIDCVNIDDAIFRPGLRTNISISIRNHYRNSATFELGATDTEGYITGGVSPSTVSIIPGGTKSAQFQVLSSSKAAIGTASLITITAKSNETSYLLYKTCRIVVGQRQRPTVESLAVSTTISSRFARTIMTSVVYNNAAVGREAEFHILLPVDAFITTFSMTIDNQTYSGRIEGREQARRIFQAARERDITAGHVAARDTSTTVFRTSVNLEPFKRVTFRLTYEELLKRKDDKYIYGVSVATLQPIKDFSIDIAICEHEPISLVSALGFDTEQSSVAQPIPVDGVTVNHQRNSARIVYRPSMTQQTQFSPYGLNGKFIVNYQLERETSDGQLLVSGSNFVHFTSPDLQPMPKRVVFVLDNSGSMFGHKQRQLRLAMDEILDSMRPEDEFGIIVFNSSVVSWSPGGNTSILAPASSTNIELAKAFLNNLEARGGTDILQAVQAGITLLTDAVTSGSADQPLGGVEENNVVSDYLILLTDGRSTDGLTNRKEIERNILQANDEKFGIHTIGLGTLVDAKMLATIAAQNHGTSVQLFLDIDTHTQMVNFFDAISRPLLSSVEISYPGEKIKKLSVNRFPSYFFGEELVVAGLYKSSDHADDALSATLTGRRRKNEISLSEDLNPVQLSASCSAAQFQATDVIERLSAFLNLKDILKKIAASTNRTEEQTLRDMALNQSLEHGIVAPGITSLVVLKPEDRSEIEETLSAEDAASTTASAPTTTEETFGRSFSLPGGEVDETLPTRSPSLSFVGDPHFIVDFGEQITVCFNWMGSENEVYNVLHDDIAGITVNAKLIQSPLHGDDEIPTYVGEIGFVFSRMDMTATLDVLELAINIGRNKPVKVSLRNKRSLKKRGVRFQTIPISDSLSVVLITFNRIQLKILSHVHSMNVDVRSHLDFSVPKRAGFSTKIVGMLGQFARDQKKEDVPATISFIPDSDEALLSYKHNLVKVKNHKLYDANSWKDIECWFVKRINALTGNSFKKYLMSHLLDRPKSVMTN